MTEAGEARNMEVGDGSNPHGPSGPERGATTTTTTIKALDGTETPRGVLSFANQFVINTDGASHNPVTGGGGGGGGGVERGRDTSTGGSGSEGGSPDVVEEGSESGVRVVHFGGEPPISPTYSALNEAEVEAKVNSFVETATAAQLSLVVKKLISLRAVEVENRNLQANVRALSAQLLASTNTNARLAEDNAKLQRIVIALYSQNRAKDALLTPRSTALVTGASFAGVVGSGGGGSSPPTATTTTVTTAPAATTVNSNSTLAVEVSSTHEGSGGPTTLSAGSGAAGGVAALTASAAKAPVSLIGEDSGSGGGGGGGGGGGARRRRRRSETGEEGVDGDDEGDDEDGDDEPVGAAEVGRGGRRARERGNSTSPPSSSSAAFHNDDDAARAMVIDALVSGLGETSRIHSPEIKPLKKGGGLPSPPPAGPGAGTTSPSSSAKSSDKRLAKRARRDSNLKVVV